MQTSHDKLLLWRLAVLNISDPITDYPHIILLVVGKADCL